MLRQILTAAAFSLMASAATAAPISPVFDAFGALPEASFSGTGISNDPVAITKFTTSNGTDVTLGMSATQRFFNPAVTNDGAGTYFATAGANNGGPGSTNATIAALWNFNFFAKVDGGTDELEDLGIELLYEFDPAVGSGVSGNGILPDFALDFLSGGTNPWQGSQNLSFGYLGVSMLGVTAPSFGPFDPNVGGEYTFALRSTIGTTVEQVAILVNVSAVPVPAGLPLVLTGMVGFGLMARRRKS